MNKLNPNLVRLLELYENRDLIFSEILGQGVIAYFPEPTVIPIQDIPPTLSQVTLPNHNTSLDIRELTNNTLNHADHVISRFNSILNFLHSNPKSSTANIAQSLDVPVQDIRTCMFKLVHDYCLVNFVIDMSARKGVPGKKPYLYSIISNQQIATRNKHHE